MESTYLQSSNLDRVGWSDRVLYIRFRSGASYRYEDVPYWIYDALVKAESHGQFFHRCIRNQFLHQRLTHDPFWDVKAA